MRANFRPFRVLAATTALNAPLQQTATLRLQGRDIRHFASQSLKSTGAILVADLPAMLVSLGAVTGTASVALADIAADPTVIPLQHVRNQEGDMNRLGIMVGVNDGPARLYMFDTGSDQFNVQIDPNTTGVTRVPGTAPQAYAYGDGTYANWVQRVQFDSLSYYDPEDTSARVAKYGGGYQAAKVLDIVYTKDYLDFKKKRVSKDPVGYGTDENSNRIPYYADLDIHQRIQNGEPGEEPPFYGVFGAADFLASTSAPSSAIGGRTKSGYIISANANLDTGATPGCAPCLLIDLDSSLRAQFTSFVPWGKKSDENSRDTFPGSGANASTQEGKYNLEFRAGDGNVSVSKEEVAVLLDTGTPFGGILYVSQAKFDKLNEAGVVKEYADAKGEYYIPSLKISAPNGQPISFDNVSVSKQSDAAPEYINFIAGLDFFRDTSVMYDLENKATGYTPYFVSANNFTTGAAADGSLQLNRITAHIGNEGLLGIAGVISGSGDLTLDPKTDVRMTNVNTYTGATYINHDASLSLAGLGSIERSAKVAADGTLDISEYGNANKYWGIPESENDAHIRSLSGGSTGVVSLGNQTLVLTAANDVFAGRINDLDEEKKHYGGGLVVAGGVQTLSGKNDYSGMTTVGSGAGLLLAGSIKHDVTTSGLLGNDGQIGGLAQANKDGVIVGAGSFGAISIADGGKVAPGSAFDPGRPIAALAVSGNFMQQAGSIYEAGLAKSSDSDRIHVTGSAAIDGGAQIELVRQGTTSVDTRYTLLTATGGVNGTYGGLTGALATDSPFVDFELVYDPNNVFLDTERTAAAFADVADTFNQRSTAAVSETLGSGNPIHDNILFLTTQETRDAFDALSGEIHASAKSALIEDSRFERDALNDRLRAAFEGVGTSAAPVLAYGEDGPVLAPATTDRLAAWGTAFGSWGSFNGNNNAAALDTSTGGLLTAFDGSISDATRLGLMVGYSHASFNTENSSGSSDNYHLGLYGGTRWGALGFRSGLAYTWHDIETLRSVAMPGFADRLSGDYNGGTLQAYGELGYRIDTQVAAFEPFANLAYVNLHTDSFTEEGGAAALTSHGETTDTTFTTLGLRASTGFTLGTMNATARGMLGWRHAYGDVKPTATHAFAGSEAFTVAGVPIAKDAVLIEAGLDLDMTETAALGVSYRGQFGSGVQENGFNAKLNVRF